MIEEAKVEPGIDPESTQGIKQLMRRTYHEIIWKPIESFDVGDREILNEYIEDYVLKGKNVGFDPLWINEVAYDNMSLRNKIKLKYVEALLDPEGWPAQDAAKKALFDEINQQ